jgi:phosphoglycerate dehydrogenase-like enzyme
MQREQSEIKVLRIGHSPYFKDDFLKLEKSALENIKGVEMLPADSQKMPPIVISNTHNKFTNEHLSHFIDTSLIIHANSGYDNFSTDFVKNFKGKIVIGNSIRAHSVANYIISSLVTHYCKIPTQREWDKTRTWNRLTLKELKIQLIGFGHIGKIINDSLKPLIDSIYIFDPYKNQNELKLETADVVIFSCSHNKSNHHFLNNLNLKKLKQDVLIINTARGELINTKDLIEHLSQNPKSFAYLDVFENEPNDFQQFSNLKNIVHTSHIAGVFSNIDAETISFEKTVIENFLHLSETEFDNHYYDSLLSNKLIQEQLI